VLLEIDGFRAGIDRYGYRLGEVIVREVAEIVQTAVRDSDGVAWLGHGRFGLRLPGTGRGGAFAVADRIREDARAVLSDRVEDPARPGPTISGGIAVLPEDGDSADQLLARAERGLARARVNGGNAVALYHDERRAWIRYPVRPSARIAVTAEDGVSAARSRGLDLSIGGALLETDPAFEAGPRVHVYVKRRGGGEGGGGWSTFAEVIRREVSKDGAHRLGVRFERPMAVEALHEYILADGAGPAPEAP
jgi:diguanylate cyclase (GGDEF)-like protein